MPPFERHVFVCGNRREDGHPRGCCDPVGAEALHKAFKQALAERGLQRRMRANRSGCLDQCEHGPTVVVYPDAVWYGGVTAATSPRSSTSTSSAASRWTRLRLAEACINTATCAHKPRRAVLA